MTPEELAKIKDDVRNYKYSHFVDLALIFALEQAWKRIAQMETVLNQHGLMDEVEPLDQNEGGKE